MIWISKISEASFDHLPGGSKEQEVGALLLKVRFLAVATDLYTVADFCDTDTVMNLPVSFFPGWDPRRASGPVLEGSPDLYSPFQDHHLGVGDLHHCLHCSETP